MCRFHKCNSDDKKMEIIRHVKEREALASIEYLKELRHSTVKEMNKIKTICENARNYTYNLCPHLFLSSQRMETLL